MTELDQLVFLLQRIAKANNESFEYRIEITPTRHGLLYNFNCFETADRHSFASGSGGNLHDAVRATRESLKACCADWGYTFPQ